MNDFLLLAYNSTIAADESVFFAEEILDKSDDAIIAYIEYNAWNIGCDKATIEVLYRQWGEWLEWGKFIKQADGTYRRQE